MLAREELGSHSDLTLPLWADTKDKEMSSSDKWEKQVKPIYLLRIHSHFPVHLWRRVPHSLSHVMSEIRALPLSPVQVLSTKEAWQKWAEPTRPLLLQALQFLTPASGHISPDPNTACPAVLHAPARLPCANSLPPLIPEIPGNPHTRSLMEHLLILCPRNEYIKRSQEEMHHTCLLKAALGKHTGLPHISLGPYGEGKAGKLTADWFVTHQDRDGSQLPSESKQGESKHYGGATRFSFSGLAAHGIL